jgi:phosphopantetheinyl transferase
VSATAQNLDEAAGRNFPRLASDVLSVWLLTPEHAGDILNKWPLEHLLAKEQLERADASEKSGGEFLIWKAAHVGLRVLLSRAIGCDPTDLMFATLPGGKPMLKAGNAFFSLTHCRDHALIAICKSRRVGIDLELPREVRLDEGRAARVLAAGRLLVPDWPLPEDANAALLTGWVRVEAYAKVHGLGLGRVLEALRQEAKTEQIVEAACRKALDRLNLVAPVTVVPLNAGQNTFAALGVEGNVELDPPEVRAFTASYR